MQVSLYTGTPGFSYDSFELKLHEEVGEIIDAIIDGQCGYSSSEELLSEVFDVMQVCYSFLLSNFAVGEIETANIEHLNKMRSRYGKD